MLNGPKIRELRHQKGYTTADLSRFTKVSKSYIEEIERGDKRNPSFDVVERIADALGSDLDDLRVCV